MEGLADGGVGWRIAITALQPSCNFLYCDSQSRFRFDGINTAPPGFGVMVQKRLSHSHFCHTQGISEPLLSVRSFDL